MSRVEVARNLSSLEEAIAFDTRFLGSPPVTVRPHSANFAFDGPALKLVVIEGRGDGRCCTDAPMALSVPNRGKGSCC